MLFMPPVTEKVSRMAKLREIYFVSHNLSMAN